MFDGELCSELRAQLERVAAQKLERSHPAFTSSTAGIVSSNLSCSIDFVSNCALMNSSWPNWDTKDFHSLFRLRETLIAPPDKSLGQCSFRCSCHVSATACLHPAALQWMLMPVFTLSCSSNNREICPILSRRHTAHMSSGSAKKGRSPSFNWPEPPPSPCDGQN